MFFKERQHSVIEQISRGHYLNSYIPDLVRLWALGLLVPMGEQQQFF